MTNGSGNTNDESHEHPGAATIVLAGEQTNGAFAIIDALERQQDEPPFHLHTREDEVIYVVTGVIEVSLAGNRSEHVAGEAVFLPKGQEHAYRLRSEAAQLVHVWTPAGIEGFYRELHRPIAQAQYIERLITLAARYGVEITGPALRASAGADDDANEGE